MRAVERRTLVITGPVNLVQGGQGLIARYPVFSLANGRFWGSSRRSSTSTGSTRTATSIPSARHWT
ncbi:hypothetical protein LZK73_15955 [Neorhizobium galegae]|nr:hypothetical protein LZK73_15955 [Neorhizobium galegae]